MWCGFIGTRIWRLKRLRRYLSHQLSWAWRHLPSCLGESYGNILGSVRNGFQRKWKKSQVSQVYVDDLITGGRTVQETQRLKEYAQTISSEAQFELHKWHSNVPALEIDMLRLCLRMPLLSLSVDDEATCVQLVAARDWIVKQTWKRKFYIENLLVSRGT